MINRFRVLETAQVVADEVNGLLSDPNQSLIHRDQLRAAAQSVLANIRANFAISRIAPAIYWRLHHRLHLIVKMLNQLIKD